MTEKQMRAIVAAAVAEALAGASKPARASKGKSRKAKPAAPVRGAAWVSDREVVRGDFRFVFTSVGQVRLLTNPAEKYSVAITRLSDGVTITRGAKTAIGQTLRERYASVSALDALVGFAAKKFTAAAA